MTTCKTITLFKIGLITCISVINTSAFSFFDASPKPRSKLIPPLSPWKSATTTTKSRSYVTHRTTVINMISEPEQQLDDDDDLDEPGTMRVKEIKSELSLRAINHSDCFDKESLVRRLREARVAGKADPSIIDQFNKQRLEDTFQERTLELDDGIIEQATAADGSLPGGISPDDLKELMANPELMALLQNPKMQDVMKLMMTGGQDSLEQMMQDDEEVYEVVTKLNGIMNEAI